MTEEIKECPYLDKICTSKCLAFVGKVQGAKSCCMRLNSAVSLVDEISIRRDYYGSKDQ
jgi:hypothetical protein